MQHQVVFGLDYLPVDLPPTTKVVSPGISLSLDPAPDLEAAVDSALETPLDTKPLHEQVKSGQRVTLAFDDPTVPCYAPVWPVALPKIIAALERGGVAQADIRLICANALHRKFSRGELASLIGDDFVRAHQEQIECHDAEDRENLVHLGTTESGLDVELNRAVCESDLTIYLNCSTTRGFSGGWKSVCVGLSTYRSITHHHTPAVMSMSLHDNRMHAMLDEMGQVVEEQLGPHRIFKLETILSNPVAVHEIYGGSVRATRAKVIEKLTAHQPPRRDLVDEPVDIVVYGVPEWSPYAAFSHNNPILDLISTGLGYLGGMIEAVGKKGCTVVLATPCPDRWDTQHHASYPEVWEHVIPATRDPDEARARFEPEFAARDDLIEKYRNDYAFHPVHGVMALYPLKRLRHAGRVIVAGAQDPAIPRHCGFETADSVEGAVAMARESHDGDATIALIEYPMAFNRQ